MRDLIRFGGEHVPQKPLTSQFCGFLKCLIKIAAVNDGFLGKERLPDVGIALSYVPMESSPSGSIWI
nr:hypothetical protein [uncultured Oscillibacter sp.]